jgi:hypothetical protein
MHANIIKGNCYLHLSLVIISINKKKIVVIDIRYDIMKRIFMKCTFFRVQMKDKRRDTLSQLTPTYIVGRTLKQTQNNENSVSQCC